MNGNVSNGCKKADVKYISDKTKVRKQKGVKRAIKHLCSTLCQD